MKIISVAPAGLVFAGDTLRPRWLKWGTFIRQRWTFLGAANSNRFRAGSVGTAGRKRDTENGADTTPGGVHECPALRRRRAFGPANGEHGAGNAGRILYVPEMLLLRNHRERIGASVLQPMQILSPEVLSGHWAERRERHGWPSNRLNFHPSTSPRKPPDIGCGWIPEGF